MNLIFDLSNLQRKLSIIMATSAAGRAGFRVFISNLPWTVGSNELRAFGSQFGNVIHSHVVFDKNTGLNKGYGFLAFGSREGFESITKIGGTSHLLEGNHINCSAATQSFFQ
jgi:hypothetical protein